MINSILMLGIASSFILVMYDFFSVRKKSRKIENKDEEIKNKDEEVKKKNAEIREYQDLIINKNYELQRLDDIIYQLKRYIIEADYKNEELKSEIKYLKSTRVSVKKFEDIDLLKKAVRKAMIYSHPDKTGTDSTEEFIEYKDLYDKLRK